MKYKIINFGKFYARFRIYILQILHNQLLNVSYESNINMVKFVKKIKIKKECRETKEISLNKIRKGN